MLTLSDPGSHQIDQRVPGAAVASDSSTEDDGGRSRSHAATTPT